MSSTFSRLVAHVEKGNYLVLNEKNMFDPYSQYSVEISTVCAYG